MTAPQAPHTRQRMRRALIARVGEEHYAFPLSAVLEALDAPEVVPLPLVPAGVAGQCEYRGRMVPVLDPRAVLDAARGDGPGTLLVLQDGALVFGLWVDDLADMVVVDALARRALPNGADRAGALVGLLAIDDLLAGVVNLGMLHATARRLLRREET
jgi:purine-binding chemotaxis protein CheW